MCCIGVHQTNAENQILGMTIASGQLQGIPVERKGTELNRGFEINIEQLNYRSSIYADTFAQLTP